MQYTLVYNFTLSSRCSFHMFIYLSYFLVEIVYSGTFSYLSNDTVSSAELLRV
jgi:hypothetical protein